MKSAPRLSILPVLFLISALMVFSTLALVGEDLSVDLLIKTPKWRLQPAPFSMAAAASDYTTEELDNALHGAASPRKSSFFDVMDSNSALASLGKVLDASQVTLRWDGVVPDYLMINPTLSFEQGPPRKIKLSADLYCREPFFKLRSISVMGLQSEGLDAVMAEFWARMDAPVPSLKKLTDGKMGFEQEDIVADTVAEVAGAVILDGDGNIKPLALNGLGNNVPKGAATQNRLTAPYDSQELTTARWGRGGMSVDVLSLADGKEYSLKKALGIPRDLFGEGYISSYASLEDVAFVGAGGYWGYLTACYFYAGGLSASDRNVVFVNYNPSNGKVTASAASTRIILQVYNSIVQSDHQLTKDQVRLADRPTVRLDPTGKHWTFLSPTAGSLLVFKNQSSEAGSFSAGPMGYENSGYTNAMSPQCQCQYNPEPGYRIFDHAFTPNGRAIVLILARSSSNGKAAEGDDSRKVVLWDFRGDTGVVVGDRNTDVKGLYNGGYSVTPSCLETVGESSGSRLFQSIRFGVTAPEAPGGILILGCNNAEYEVWKFAITATPPKDRDHGSILLKHYFTGSFPSIYKGAKSCPLQIEPRYNRVRIGGEGMLEHRLLYSAPFEQTQ